MEWTVSPPHRELLSDRENDPLYILHYLRVHKEDPHLEAFTEFWRRLLSEGPGFWTSSPETLWFQFWSDEGSITAVFASEEDYGREEPGVYKLYSGQIQEEYEEIADREDVDDSFSIAHDAMIKKYWDLFLQAASTEPVPQLLKEARARSPFGIMATYCCYRDEPLEVNL